MLPSAVTDIKAFVPAKDLERSKPLYSDLGFIINFSNDQIAVPSAFCCRSSTSANMRVIL
jgi:predicted lactoylglutathione lyase